MIKKNNITINEITKNILSDLGKQPITDLLEYYNIHKFNYKKNIEAIDLNYTDEFITEYIDDFLEIQQEIYNKINNKINELFITIDKQISASKVIQKYWKNYKH